MSEKMQGGELRVENRFTRWLDNYWYHYKWHTVIGVFVLIVVLIFKPAGMLGKKTREKV